MRIRTRGDVVDIAVGTLFVEVYANSRFGPVVCMEAISEPVVEDDRVTWMARNIETGEKVRYGAQLESWQYSPALYLPNSIEFNERIKPYRPWFNALNMPIFKNGKTLKKSEEQEEPMQKKSWIKCVREKIFTKETLKKMSAERLYRTLASQNLEREGYRINDLQEGISVVEETIDGWWKQRYLVDENKYHAYEIMDENMIFTHFMADDIDWKSIDSLPDYMIERARRLSALFPTFVSRFQNGVAEVSWELNPDGRYYRDDDGYGMTDDEETTVYGFIDTEMNVLVKFQYIGDDRERLKEMRHEAERKAKKE